MSEKLETIRTLEQCLLNSWPSSRTVHCDGWVLRHAGGYTKRANSASAFAPLWAFSSTLAKARRFYAAHDEPAIFRLTPLANPDSDDILADTGFAKVDSTLVMTAPLAAAHEAGQGVEIVTQYSNAWGGAYAAARGLTQKDMRAHGAILHAIALPTAFASWRANGEALAFGLGVLDHGWLGIFDIATSPYARRQGGAKSVVSALVDWGKTLGAHSAWLSVIADNHPALALYDQFGFERCYRYHYRVESRGRSVYRPLPPVSPVAGESESSFEEHDGRSGSSRASVALSAYRE